jgi:7-keto-8-aminopelargonate synthetase-like enzyme
MDHQQLECELAQFMDADDAIVFNSGFLTNVATVSALVGKGDLVIGDEYNHASLHDGCIAPQAMFNTFRHNRVEDPEMLLWEHSGRKILVVVDAVQSMEGDIAPMPEIVRLCKAYGALLMVDEAHSLGVIGESGRGIQEHCGLPADAIDIKMGTLSKSIASCGGFVAAKQEHVVLKHSARGFIFSSALREPPEGQRWFYSLNDEVRTIEMQPQEPPQEGA